MQGLDKGEEKLGAIKLKKVLEPRGTIKPPLFPPSRSSSHRLIP